MAVLATDLIGPPEIDAQTAPAKKAIRSAGQQAEGRRSTVWEPGSGLKQVPIWPALAPHTSAGGKPETVRADWPRVENVSRPTMTVYAPKSHNTGVAVVVFPGGGFQFLAMD